MHKSKQARKEQFQQVDFYRDDYKIVIQPPTFKSLSQAFSYFVQHQTQFSNSDEDDGDDIPVNVESPITDVHDSIDYFEEKMRQRSQNSPSKPTNEGESAGRAKSLSAPPAREPERGGAEEMDGAAPAAPDSQ